MDRVTRTEIIDALTDLWVDCVNLGEAQGANAGAREQKEYREIADDSWSRVENFIQKLLDNQREV